VEPDKDKIIKMVQDLLEDPKLKSLTKEELAVVLYNDVIEPVVKELQEHYSLIAYKFGNYEPGSAH
jgi:hypothetical protein